MNELEWPKLGLLLGNGGYHKGELVTVVATTPDGSNTLIKNAIFSEPTDQYSTVNMFHDVGSKYWTIKIIHNKDKTKLLQSYSKQSRLIRVVVKQA